MTLLTDIGGLLFREIEEYGLLARVAPRDGDPHWIAALRTDQRAASDEDSMREKKSEMRAEVGSEFKRGGRASGSQCGMAGIAEDTAGGEATRLE
jgi:hypothetical protein